MARCTRKSDRVNEQSSPQTFSQHPTSRTRRRGPQSGAPRVRFVYAGHNEIVPFYRTPNFKNPEQMKKDGKPKRPCNSFMIFRRTYQEFIRSACTATVIDPDAEIKIIIREVTSLSDEITKQWKSLSNTERAVWVGYQKLEKDAHLAAHPNYVYRPEQKAFKKPNDSPSEDGLAEDDATSTSKLTGESATALFLQPTFAVDTHSFVSTMDPLLSQSHLAPPAQQWLEPELSNSPTTLPYDAHLHGSPVLRSDGRFVQLAGISRDAYSTESPSSLATGNGDDFLTPPDLSVWVNGYGYDMRSTTASFSSPEFLPHGQTLPPDMERFTSFSDASAAGFKHMSSQLASTSSFGAEPLPRLEFTPASRDCSWPWEDYVSYPSRGTDHTNTLNSIDPMTCYLEHNVSNVQVK